MLFVCMCVGGGGMCVPLCCVVCVRFVWCVCVLCVSLYMCCVYVVCAYVSVCSCIGAGDSVTGMGYEGTTQHVFSMPSAPCLSPPPYKAGSHMRILQHGNLRASYLLKARSPINSTPVSSHL